jgi:hypothetical protein
MLICGFVFYQEKGWFMWGGKTKQNKKLLAKNVILSLAPKGKKLDFSINDPISFTK